MATSDTSSSSWCFWWTKRRRVLLIFFAPCGKKLRTYPEVTRVSMGSTCITSLPMITEPLTGIEPMTSWAQSLCKHACKSVCNVHPGIDPCPLLARSCNRWWLDFVTFTAYEIVKIRAKRGTKAQCVSNRCKELFTEKKYFGVRCTLTGVWDKEKIWVPDKNRTHNLPCFKIGLPQSLKHICAGTSCLSVTQL